MVFNNQLDNTKQHQQLVNKMQFNQPSCLCFYLFLVINFLLVNYCSSASLKSSSSPSFSISNDYQIYSGDNLPNCSRADLTFAADNPIPKQSNGTTFLPDFDPTVVLNVVDAIVNGDLWNDVVSGIRTVFTHWRDRLSLNPPSPSTKSFPENSTNSANQLPLVAFD